MRDTPRHPLESRQHGAKRHADVIATPRPRQQQTSFQRLKSGLNAATPALARIGTMRRSIAARPHRRTISPQ
ncbi:hypothetical protein [Paraburkholderia sp. J69-1]|uniref:hypothetical protein n=1 Tax=Paraburkholderia sp. J69-1 TaxID=2805436 RepID=UPI002AB69EE3|nr:hypothetical protein [Paraburkholderia sp. J69-1]